MPGRDALERGTGTNQRRFSQMSGHELECDRQMRSSCARVTATGDTSSALMRVTSSVSPG
jgi:hypothetical protein